jgi:hypothetical protein
VGVINVLYLEILPYDFLLDNEARKQKALFKGCVRRKERPVTLTSQSNDVGATDEAVKSALSYHRGKFNNAPTKSGKI